MTVVTADVRDITGVNERAAWEFSSVIRESDDGTFIVSPRRVKVKPVSGVITVDLDPGYAEVSFAGKKYPIEVPDSGPADLWGLIEASIAFPPDTPGGIIDEAIESYLEINAADAISDAVEALDARINVKSYGAVGNGSTNDTTAVNAAISACSAAGGGIVLFPPGTFVVSLTIKSNVTLQGAGRGATTLKLPASSTSDVIQSLDFTTLTGTSGGGGVVGVTIRDLTVDGNKANAASGGRGIAIWGPGFLIQDVDVKNCHGHGLVLDYAGGSVVNLESNLIRVKAYNGDADGFHALGAHDSYAIGCIAAENDGIGFNAGGSGWNWIGCHSWGYQDYAWKMSGTNYLTNCHGEGGTIAQFFIDWHEVSIIGGSAFYPGGVSAVGVKFAATTPLPKSVHISGLRCYMFTSSTGAAIDLTNLGDQAYIDCVVDQASGTAIVGTPPADAYVNIQVGGGTSTASVVQMPGLIPALPKFVLTDTFTAANSSAPNSANWTTGIGAGSGAAISIQGNTVQLTPGATGGYSSTDFVSLQSNVGAAVIDAEIVFCLISSSVSTESYLFAGIRSSNANPLAGSDAYTVSIAQFTNGNRQVSVNKRVSGSNTSLYTGAATATTNGAKTWYRFRVQGSALTLRVWNDGSAEPVAPTWAGVDTSITAGGLVTFALGGGNAAASGVQKIDNASIYAL